MANASLLPIQKHLRTWANSTRAESSKRFFKTTPGAYGEGDLFIGVCTPIIRQIAKAHSRLSSSELSHVLQSPIHEDRLLALVILVTQYQSQTLIQKKEKIVDFYLQHTTHVNSWDLVDLSAYKILGAYTQERQDGTLIQSLAHSSRHWDQRIGMVGTYAWIRAQQIQLTLTLAPLFFQSPENLMHQATGWMLREAWKRDPEALFLFIHQHASKMPRKMLRYSIEKWPETERKKILRLSLSTKSLLKVQIPNK